jgi:putative transposase
LVLARPVVVGRSPTAARCAQQIVNAFPWDTVPKYRIRDRDPIWGKVFRDRVNPLGIRQDLFRPLLGASDQVER